MTNIKGDRIILRAVEPSDVKSLYQWENDVDLWPQSGTLSPFSHHTLSLFIESQREDIFASKQLRLMICSTESGVAVGVLDLFEFDPLHHRAGVGIMIAPAFRRMGYAASALRAVENYCTTTLHLHQLWCSVEEDNLASFALFASLGYQRSGIKQDWNLRPEGYVSEIFLQKIL